ncbi:PAS domain S-box protein [Muricoccus aerilatus]|uniref:PAS domain S-box protein n=1 Tax=Muricoccus aerilatus TaxID=452982 RepID=UPI000A07652B|nr:PAS domain S-box protein [Roseomonas aerilata]
MAISLPDLVTVSQPEALDQSGRSFPVLREEEARLTTLAAYELEHAPTEPDLQHIAALAADLFQAPIALVSLVAHERQFFRGQVGLEAPGTPRDVSFCAHAIMGDEVFVVPDATLDPRFCDNPLVTGEPGIRFYAGAPLVSPLGDHRLGSLCVIDRVPRPPLTARECRLLAALAGLGMDRLERHRLEIQLRSTLARFESMAAATQNAVVCVGADHRMSFWNAAAERLLGWSAANAIGQDFSLIIPDRLRAAHEAGFTRVLAASEGSPYPGRTVELPALRRDGRELPAEVTLSAWREDGRQVFGATIRDISARQRAQAELLHLAHHDPLTGLANRGRFTEVVGHHLEEGAPAGLVLLGLDGFKQVNGHWQVNGAWLVGASRGSLPG